MIVGWLGIEAGFAVAAAGLAGSVALLGFGLDSGIEAPASVIVIWRFKNLLRAYLAAAVLARLLANTLLDVWWLDGAVALAIAAWAVARGREPGPGEAAAAPASPTQQPAAHRLRASHRAFHRLSSINDE